LRELSKYDLKYKPRGTNKGEVLADFVTEFSPPPEASIREGSGWILSGEGSSNLKDSEAGLF